jgi:asparagine synthase (glutamine-hydrolysing)
VRSEVAWIAHEAASGRVFLARDLSGSRPLYVAEALPAGGPFGMAASDPEVLLRAGADATPCPEAQAWIAAAGFVPAPLTPWKGVRALAPGEVCVYDSRSGARLSWSDDTPRVAPPPLQPTGRWGNAERWQRSVGWALALAVRLRAQGAGLLAVALSGSASRRVLELALEARRGAPVLALTWQRPGEEAAAAEAAAWCAARGVEHRVVPVAPADEAALAAEVRPRGWPLGPEEACWTALARASWEVGADVLLHGIGAAELWGGPAPLRRLAWAEAGALDAADRWLHRLRGAERPSWPEAPLQSVGVLRAGSACPPGLEGLAAAIPPGSLTGRTRALLRKLLADSRLAEVDRACARAGLRARAPYLDAPLVELVQTVPSGQLAALSDAGG